MSKFKDKVYSAFAPKAVGRDIGRSMAGIGAGYALDTARGAVESKIHGDPSDNILKSINDKASKKGFKTYKEYIDSLNTDVKPKAFSETPKKILEYTLGGMAGISGSLVRREVSSKAKVAKDLGFQSYSEYKHHMAQKNLDADFSESVYFKDMIRRISKEQ